MEELRNFTMAKLYQKLMMHDNEFDAWLESLGLLHSKRTCECGKEMKIKQKAGYRNGAWRCNASGCKKERGYMSGTFFEGSNFLFF